MNPLLFSVGGGCQNRTMEVEFRVYPPTLVGGALGTIDDVYTHGLWLAVQTMTIILPASGVMISFIMEYPSLPDSLLRHSTGTVYCGKPNLELCTIDVDAM